MSRVCKEINPATEGGRGCSSTPARPGRCLVGMTYCERLEVGMRVMARYGGDVIEFPGVLTKQRGK
eukprot:6104568-Prymnesium_polylepis.1